MVVSALVKFSLGAFCDIASLIDKYSTRLAENEAKITGTDHTDCCTLIAFIAAKTPLNVLDVSIEKELANGKLVNPMAQILELHKCKGACCIDKVHVDIVFKEFMIRGAVLSVCLILISMVEIRMTNRIRN